MIKKITTIFGLLLMLCIQAQAQSFESATDAVKNMGVGWNLGNTFDSYNQEAEIGWTWDSVADHEKKWSQPITTPELIKMMKEAGFGAIRVPVTWFQEMDADGKVNEAFMKRIHEVVDYVIDAGLYCIINVHHDTGANDYAWVIADYDNYEKTKARYENLWTQIANEFKDYDQHLLFAAYNEMLDKYQSWCFAMFQRPDGYDKDEADAAYQGLNNYAQSFVNAVRATGSNNEQRNLIINTYCSANGIGNWNDHLTDVLTEIQMPADVTEGHIAFEVHAYPNLASGKNEVDEIINKVNTYLLPMAPVIIGEWGTSNVDKTPNDYDNSPNKYLEFCKYFIEQTKENNIATFYWMGLSDGLFRTYPAFNQPKIAEVITKAYHGDDFEGVYPIHEPDAETLVFEGEQELEWGTAIQFPASLFTDLSSTSTVEVTYTEKFDQFSGDEANSYLQFWYNDWSSMINFTADGQEISETLEVNKFYNSTSGTEHTTVFAFDKETFKNFKKKGMLFQGHGVVVTKVVLKAGEPDPDEGDTDSEVFWEGDEMLNWGDGLQLDLPAEKFANYGKDVVLGLSYTIAMDGDSDYNMIQLFYGDWVDNPSFIINGKEIAKEYNPTNVHGLQNGDDGTSELTFSEAVYNQIAERGIALQGHGLRLKKVTFSKSGSTGIKSASTLADDPNAPIYNLSGQRVTNPTKGIYIRNGKKIVIK